MIVTIPQPLHSLAAPVGAKTVVKMFWGAESAASFSVFARESLDDLFGRNKRRKGGYPSVTTVVMIDTACLYAARTHDLVHFTGWLPQLKTVLIFFDDKHTVCDTERAAANRGLVADEKCYDNLTNVSSDVSKVSSDVCKVFCDD